MSLYHISLKVLCLQAHITEHIYSCKLEWGVMYRLIQVTYDPVFYLASSCVMCCCSTICTFSKSQIDGAVGIVGVVGHFLETR